MTLPKVTPEMDREMSRIVSEILSEIVGRSVEAIINSDIGWEGKSLLKYEAKPPLDEREKKMCDLTLHMLNHMLGGTPMIKPKRA